MLLHHKIQTLLDNLYFDNWPSVIIQRAFFRKERLVVYRKGKVILLVDFAGGDQCGTRPCLTSDMYSRYFAHFNHAHPLTVLDLGANGGGFPLSMLIAGFTFSKLVCVEMNRSTYTRLWFNLTYNLPKVATAINAAAAGRKGTVTVSDSLGGTSESIYSELAEVGQNSVEIPLISLDDLVQTHFGAEENRFIDVCKMDIEKAEYEVFHSQTCSTIRRVRHLIIEVHPHASLSETDLIEKICSFGFELITDEKSQVAGVYLFKNVKLRG